MNYYETEMANNNFSKEFINTIMHLYNDNIVELEITNDIEYTRGLKYLIAALHYSKSLTKLSLINVGLNSKNIYELVDCLIDNKSMTDLDLSKNKFDVDDIKYIIIKLIKLNVVI
ncbi:MAG: hypothetical protein ACYCPT_08315 [Acidimicrobiales bacterium]